MRLVWLLLFFLLGANGQNPCSNPTNPGQSIICNNIFKWDNIAKTAIVKFAQSTLPKEWVQGIEGFFAGLEAAPLAAGGPASDRYQCMNWQCVCNFIQGAYYANGACQLPGGGSLSRCTRQEYRLMTDNARYLYTQGFYAVYSEMYSTLAAAHSNPMQSPGAHSGPAFLPWHRELMRRLEVAIRTAQVNGRFPFSSVCIPYWDNTMDADIYTVMGNEPTASVMFSNELLGSVRNGYLTDGMFANFAGRQGRTYRQLNRWPGQLLLMSRPDVDNIMTSQTVNQVLAATAGTNNCPPLPQNTLEIIHGSPHVWVGGNMEQILTSTNDPAFFLHHCFVDFVWEGWRIRRQTSAQREVQYNTAPLSCYAAAHQANAQMVPFPGLVNSDGLSNIYTQVFYNHAQRPQCSASALDCGSRFLWCYVAGRRCVGRLKAYEWCYPISGVDPCYQGRCSSQYENQWGQCIPYQRRQGWNETKPFDLSTVPQLDKYPYETCFNNKRCCDVLIQNDGCKDPEIRSECKASCKLCNTLKEYKDDCEDRHHLCKIFKKDGYCSNYPEYMAENCRTSCDLCSTSRAQDCAGKNSANTIEIKKASKEYPKQKLKYEKKNSLTCTNQNICCQYWKETKGCEKLAVLQKQCAASCLCKPNHDLYSCSDFYDNCKSLRDDGKCKEPDVRENCRNTCGSCPTATALKSLCG